MAIQRQKFVGVVLLGIGITALVIAAFQFNASRSKAGIVPLDIRPIQGINPQADGPGDAPRITVPGTPAPGQTHYVWARAKPHGDGSWKRPFNDLQESLCALQPGDRLLVMGTRYEGPFEIGKDCSDGTEAMPIEVYFADDALVHNPVVREATELPVLTIDRHWWVIAGIEIQPLWYLSGILVGPNARHIRIESAHIKSGLGRGIDISPGASDILIQDSHLHQLGTLEGRSGEWPKGQGAGVRIAPGTSRISVLGTQIHNVLGKPALVISPEEYASLPGLQPASDIVIEASGFQENQRKWWK